MTFGASFPRLFAPSDRRGRQQKNKQTGKNRKRGSVTYRLAVGDLEGRVEVQAARVVERVGGRGRAAGVVGGGRGLHAQVAVKALDLEDVHELRPPEHSAAEEHGLDDADHEDDDPPGEGQLEVRVLAARHAASARPALRSRIPWATLGLCRSRRERRRRLPPFHRR